MEACYPLRMMLVLMLAFYPLPVKCQKSCTDAAAEECHPAADPFPEDLSAGNSPPPYPPCCTGCCRNCLSLLPCCRLPDNCFHAARPLSSEEFAETSGENEACTHKVLTASISALTLAAGLTFCILYRKKAAALQAAVSYIGDLHEIHSYRMQEAAEEARDSERRRLGADLHDHLASTLSTAVHQIRYRSLQEPDAAEVEQLKRLADLVNEAYLQVRNRSHQLFLGERQPPPFIEELKKSILLLFTGTGVQVACEIEDPGLWQLPAEIKVCVLHTIREAAANILKHAGARNAVILMYADEGQLHLSISDDGQGYPAAGFRYGVGLQSIRERVLRLNGRFRVGPQAQGTLLELQLPLPLHS